jgi:defect-in-organelle-trafficking protein DotC
MAEERILEKEALKAGRVLEEAAEGHLRERAIKEAALSAAAEAGARWRYGQILKKVVLPREKELDELFDFSHLVVAKGRLVVIPPVATQAGEAIRLAGTREALGQDGSYSLISRARLSGLKPDWRHYLMETPKGPDEIHPSLFPGGAGELAKWQKEIDRGWALGVEQADRLFASNVAILTRDYVGMMIFKRLVAERIAHEAPATETVTGLEVADDEIIFQKTLYRLVGQDGFVDPGKKGVGQK